MAPLLNIDLGELADEPAELWSLADLANIACGGHAGDEASMRAAVAAALSQGVGIGAHPSTEDRPGFGRRPVDVPLDVLGDAIFSQCLALRTVADELGGEVGHLKPHGALYHACQDPLVAAVVVDAATGALGPVAVLGPEPMLAVARARGLVAVREGYADRGVGPDGRLIPRGQPGDLITDPLVAALRAQALISEVETICVHGDSPGAVALARAVRAVLGPRV